MVPGVETLQPLSFFEWGEEIPPRWDATERDARVKGGGDET
jgi:hypothetical protein